MWWDILFKKLKCYAYEDKVLLLLYSRNSEWIQPDREWRQTDCRHHSKKSTASLRRLGQRQGWGSCVLEGWQVHECCGTCGPWCIDTVYDGKKASVCSRWVKIPREVLVMRAHLIGCDLLQGARVKMLNTVTNLPLVYTICYMIVITTFVHVTITWNSSSFLLLSKGKDTPIPI